MATIVDFLTPDDFDSLLPLIKAFAEETKTPFYQHVAEVATSLMSDSTITVVAKDSEDGNVKILAYLSGYILNPTDFHLTQAYSTNPKITPIIGDFLDQHLILLGIKRIIALFIANPKVAERHGFKLARYLMLKELQ